MSRRMAAEGQLSLLDLLDPEPPSLPECLYRSPTRGLAARIAELEAWRQQYGNQGCLHRSHGWHLAICASGEPAGRCLPSYLDADLRPWNDDDRPPCGCNGPLLYRGACRGCDWEGPERDRGNPAVEDAHDHAWPGWRDLPAVARVPYEVSGTSKAAQRARDRWIELVTVVYPHGWLEAGGRIRTLREPGGSRHVEHATPFGGYDLATREAAC